MMRVLELCCLTSFTMCKWLSWSWSIDVGVLHGWSWGEAVFGGYGERLMTLGVTVRFLKFTLYTRMCPWTRAIGNCSVSSQLGERHLHVSLLRVEQFA
ncbi:hypothetical protein AUEXF2481DRAFT_160106 [Aureobasidium subglaciale EXF-2481]|uniref:Secreted protein n=1 Tax=Aureobasidium subglaciale (strain EXF-2481) TaxID=1043005 RepID=A0A074Z3C2_AURSE|nr:uncharacterized protein AUEXF2481DRAFT_160106 [Aureobasidium subglaciale EXF-2481]KER00793.1 hypothetical protein AUEXF2481DRAFT_160106 [Aureobasidium subglaciale EXF-2481]